MSRKRSIEQEWYDVFGGWEPDDQAAAIKMLVQIHRQLKRQALGRLVKNAEDEYANGQTVNLYNITDQSGEEEKGNQ